MSKIAVIAGVEYQEINQATCSGCTFLNSAYRCTGPKFAPNHDGSLLTTTRMGLVPCIALNNGQAIFIKNTPEALAEYFAQKVTR